MKKFITKRRSLLLCSLCLVATAITSFSVIKQVSADNNSDYGFSMSPMKENMILNPGETYESSFTIFNPATNPTDFNYEITVTPFYVDENYENIFTEESGRSEIVEWITVDSPLSGSIEPNEAKEIYFTVNVPSSAPAGGQYAAITVTSADPTLVGDKSAVVERTAIAHTIFAEIAGNTVRNGEVEDVNVPSFLLSGEIYGESTIKNVGNVHGTASYTLKVTPLFSNEEIYTNAEDPVTHDILPDRSYYNKITMPNTPGMGLFNVTYTVDYEGVVTEVTKLVIICPVWLIFIVIAIIILIIIAIVFKIKKGRARG